MRTLPLSPKVAQDARRDLLSWSGLYSLVSHIAPHKMVPQTAMSFSGLS
jgi:hypothetical protein